MTATPQEQMGLFQGTHRQSPTHWQRPEVEPPDPSGRGFYDYNIGLIACSKSKLDRPAPARELYTGSLFRKARAYCERMCPGWYVLSAEHGLVGPDQVLAPYEKTLTTAGVAERRAWGERVLEQLRIRLGTGFVWQFVVLAGQDYWQSLPPTFWELGTRAFPLKGCRGLGDQMARLDRLVSEYDSWGQTPVGAQLQPVPGFPEWSAALSGRTVWVREPHGAWIGPFQREAHGLRAGRQLWQCRPDWRREDGWAHYFPRFFLSRLEELFPGPEQQQFLDDTQVARRGRRRVVPPQTEDDDA